MDIERCNGQATIDESLRACALCVALNRTIFKANNKPNYSHPYCKCTYKEVYLNKVLIEFPVEKITKWKIESSKPFDFRQGDFIV